MSKEKYRFMYKSESLQKSLTTVAKGATIVFIGLLAGKILGTVNQVILARFMGPEDYGRFNIVLSVVTIVFSISSFGMMGSLPRFIPYNLKLGRRDKARSVVDFSALFVFSANILAAAIVFVFSGRIARDIFNDPQLEILLRVFSVGIPVIAVNRVAIGIIRGFKSAKYDALLFKIGTRVINILVFLVFVAFGYRLYGAVIAFIIGALITSIIAIWLVKKKVFPDYSECSRVPVAGEIMKFTWPLALTGLMFIVLSKTDMMLLGYFLSSKEVGIYTPAIMIARLMLFISMAFKYMFLPVVSEFFSHGDMDGLKSLYQSVSKWIMLTVLPMTIYFVVFPSGILRILYGREYTEGNVALIILAVGVSINLLQGTSGNILIGGGYTKLNFLAEFFTAVANVILNIILIPVYGILGAAIATSISYLLRNVCFVVFIYKTFNMHPYKRNYLNILLSSLVSFSLLLVLKNYLPITWWGTMIAAGIILPALYMLLIIATRSFDENDLFVLEGIERKFRIKLGFIKKFIRS